MLSKSLISILLLSATTLVTAAPAPATQTSACASGKPFTGQAGCSTCSTEGNIVCGRDEDITTDLKCTRFSTGLIWVPINNPGACGVDYPVTTSASGVKYPVQTSAPSPSSVCKSGKPFTGQAGCSTCSTEGNIVCGRDEDKTTDLKCTRFSTGLTWVPINNPGACGVDSPRLKARDHPMPQTTCNSGKPFTGQAGCSTCSTEGNIVCGRDEDKTTDLKCTRFSTGLIWVPINNPGACGVDYPVTTSASGVKYPVQTSAPIPRSVCKSGKPFTGEAGCSKCSKVGNIVCGRDEDRTTDLKCTAFGTSLTWVPIDNPRKCGV